MPAIRSLRPAARWDSLVPIVKMFTDPFHLSQSEKERQETTRLDEARGWELTLLSEQERTGMRRTALPSQ